MEYPKARLISSRPEEANGQLDLEKAADDVHLHNDTVNTLYWDKICVKVEDKTSRQDRYLLDSIDGAALAGQSSVLIVSTLRTEQHSDR